MPAITEPSKLDDRMKDVAPDRLTPREALDLIYELKGLAGD